jgi:branched-chain amino acid transport system substrate-binding protein
MIALIGSGSAAADVKIGFLAGFTGPLKSLAPGMYKGAKLAAKHVNDQGGILDGQQIIMPSGDSTCSDVTAAVDAAAHLVEDENVLAIVGPLCSGAAIAIYKNVTIPAGITVVSPSATSPAITSLDDGDLVFRTSPSDVYQGGIMARLLISKGIKHIVITYVDNDWGKGISAELSSAFEAAGGKVAGNMAHEEGKTDYMMLSDRCQPRASIRWSCWHTPTVPVRQYFARRWKAVLSTSLSVETGWLAIPLSRP